MSNYRYCSDEIPTSSILSSEVQPHTTTTQVELQDKSNGVELRPNGSDNLKRPHRLSPPSFFSLALRHDKTRAKHPFYNPILFAFLLLRKLFPQLREFLLQLQELFPQLQEFFLQLQEFLPQLQELFMQLQELFMQLQEFFLQLQEKIPLLREL